MALFTLLTRTFNRRPRICITISISFSKYEASVLRKVVLVCHGIHKQQQLYQGNLEVCSLIVGTILKRLPGLVQPRNVSPSLRADELGSAPCRKNNINDNIASSLTFQIEISPKLDELLVYYCCWHRVVDARTSGKTESHPRLHNGSIPSEIEHVAVPPVIAKCTL